MHASVAVLLGAVCLGANVQAAVASVSVLVDWSRTFQEIDGFGASNAFNRKADAITPEIYELLFSEEKGVGLSLLRTEIPDDGSCIPANGTGSLPADLHKCIGSPNTLNDIQVAESYGVRVWGVPWSPPAIYKTNKNVIGGSLMRKFFPKYAEYLLNYVKSIKEVTGVDLYGLSVQNEPVSKAPRPTCYYTPLLMNAFINGFLGPAIGKRNLQLIMPEVATIQQLPPFMKKIPRSVDIVAFHNYDANVPLKGGNPYSPRRFWQTETSGLNKLQGPMGGQWDPSMKDALIWAYIIHGWLVNASVNAWHYWWLTNRRGMAANRNNQALIDVGGEPSHRLFVMGNYAKFVRPGWFRISALPANPRQDVFVSGFMHPLRKGIAVVVINRSPNVVHMDVGLKLGKAIPSVIPWVTAQDIKLVPQEPLNVTYTAMPNGADNTFSFTLAPLSVTTFVYKEAPSA